MPTLFLHIGHGKTGTSWIQACLRINRESLAKRGIIYALGEDRDIEQPELITSGNASFLFQSREHFEEYLAINQRKAKGSLLFSSEHIPNNFLNSNGEEYLEEIALRFGFDKISVLLFIRNPISLAVSMWRQRIKGRGDFDVTLTNLHENPDIGWDVIYDIEKIINRLNHCKMVTLTIRNYSNCNTRLMNEVEEWLGIPAETVQIPDIKRINRSLTFSELALQQSFNKILGKSGQLISIPFCEKLTSVEPEELYPPIEVQELIYAQLKPTIDRLNKFIEEKHQYRCDIQKPGPTPEMLTFSHQHIKILSENLGNEINNLRKQVEETKNLVASLRNENQTLRARIANPFQDQSILTITKTLLNRVLQKFQKNKNSNE
jgi:hypothetical protein